MATVKGWIRTSRFAKRVSFIHLYGVHVPRRFLTPAGTVQVVLSPAASPELKRRLTVGAAVQVEGRYVESKGGEQAFELLVEDESQVTILGDCDASEYPVQKKEATPEFWRSIPHLRARAAEYRRIFLARASVSKAIHDFFAEEGFHWVHTPLITFSDCEGAGEMFVLKDEEFFGKPGALTVSGQLEVETFCMSLGRVYTFGPTFRAEDSHTSRHASEFWMIEPEMAFASLDEIMGLAESFIWELLRGTRASLGPEALAVLETFEGEDAAYGDGFADEPAQLCARVTYTEAMELLVASGVDFVYPVGWGESLQAEHEKWLAGHFGKPVFVTHYPIEQKPFYMRVTDGCEEGRQTVECFDLLVPGVGEIIGGSAREERLDKLLWQMERCAVDLTEYDWYVDLRRFGSAPHGGFGLGLERFLMWALGVSNIRDVLPFPRTPA